MSARTTTQIDDMTVTVEPIKGFVTFERTISARQYEPAKASLMLQIPTDTSGWRNLDGTLNRERIIADAKDVFFVAKSVVFEQLGIEYRITPELVVQDILEKSLAAVEISPAEAAIVAETANVVAAAPPAPVTPQRRAPSGDGPSLVGKAAWLDLAANPGKWFDNRADKESGRAKPTSPDFKRKGTGEVLWLVGRDGKSQIPAGVDLSALGVY